MGTRAEAVPGRARIGSAARQGMLARVIATEASGTQLMLRLVLGGVMLPHGLQKVFGWFGGHGFEGTMGFLTGSVGLPWLIALLVVLIESAGAAALILGVLSRVAATGIIAVMVGAVFTGHLANGFFMNWGGTQAGEGFEYHLLAIALAAAVVVKGAGAASVDRALARRIG